MRPSASDQSGTDLALNEVFGTQGQIRLLRILTTETEGTVTSPEVAKRTGLTPSGARKALRRLARVGVVEKVGTGKATRYALSTGGRLADEIVKLFELEREALDPEWIRGGPENFGQETAARETAEKPNGNGGSEKPNGTGLFGKAQDSPPPVELDPESPEFHDGLVALLEENLSLINRAREKILQKLENRHPNNGHDDWEWRKIFDTYPLPRLLHFLESNSPRAERLRKSSPFPEVMSEGEKKRLRELVERVH
ncbi:MAG: winged helix-turn-helix domain-containing protein [Gemmatimonadota bacterium]